MAENIKENDKYKDIEKIKRKNKFVFPVNLFEARIHLEREARGGA